MAIPGVITTIRDRFYSVSRSDIPTGPKVVAIAKRTTDSGTGNISDVDVVRATNEADVITAFGDGSDIHRAYIELVTAGVERIYLVPLPSDTVFDHTNGTIESDTFDSSSGGLFDAAFDAAEAIVPDIVMPWGRGGHPYDWDELATPSTPEFGFHADNSATIGNSWAFKVADKAKLISKNTNPCIAVLGVAPYVASDQERMTPSQVSTHLSAIGDGTTLADSSSTTVTGDNGESMSTVAPYLVVVAAELKPVNYSSGGTSFGYTNGAAAMVAAMTSVPAYASVTTAQVYNVESLRYSATRTLQGDLSDMGVNSVIINFNRVPAISDGVTFATPTSDYTRITTKRIIDDATRIVRQVCQKFIGQPANMQIRNSMETAVSAGLRGMQILGAILSHEFSVTYVPSENRAIIDLVLTPAFELKNIELQVAVNL